MSETNGTSALAIAPTNATLYGKMARAMGIITRVPKTGNNTFHRYRYATADDVADIIREALSEVNLALIVRMGEIKQETIEYVADGKSKSTIRTTIKFDFIFACGDTGATISSPWVGQVDDNSDKAVSKCATAAEKYFLMKTFIVSAGDEPDADSDKHREDAGRKVAAKWQATESNLHYISERAFTAGYISERNGKGVTEMVTMLAALPEPKTWDDFASGNDAWLAIKEIGEARKVAKAAAKIKTPEPEITEPGAVALLNGKSPFTSESVGDAIKAGTPEVEDGKMLPTEEDANMEYERAMERNP